MGIQGFIAGTLGGFIREAGIYIPHQSPKQTLVKPDAAAWGVKLLKLLKLEKLLKLGDKES